MRTRSTILSTTALAATLAIALTACSNTPPKSEEPPADEHVYSAGDLTLEDRPEKIVSLSATATEMLFAIDAGEQVTAVDSTSNYPESAPRTELDAFTPNVESIAGYEPDLVVISNDQQDILAKLEEAKVPVYFAPAAATLDDTFQQINDLGELTGHADEAETLATQMEADIDKLVDDMPDIDESMSVYYELSSDLYSLTSNTFAGSLLKEAGLDNIADEADDAADTGGYPQLSAEFVLDANPDIIFVTTGGEKAAKELAGRSGWKSVNAVKDKNVVAIDDDIASRWGPRVVDLMAAITEAVAKAA